MHTSFKSAALLSVLGFMVAVSVRAETPASPIHGIPREVALQNAPLAAWVKPGARFTFAQSHGTHFFAFNQLTPAKPGEQDQFSIQDPADPTRCLTIHALRSESVDHLVEAQIVGIAGGKVYCVHRVWQPLIFEGENKMSPIPGPVAAVFPVGMFAKRYVSPAILNKLPDVHAVGQTTERTTVKYGGREIPALSLLTDRGPIWESSSFDLQTGLLIGDTTRFQDQDYAAHFGGQDPRGALVIDHLEFKGMRQVAYPWLGKPAPDWIAKVKSITARQQLIATNSRGGSGPVKVPDEDITLQVIARGDDWLATAQFEPGKGPETGGTPLPDSARMSGGAAGPGCLFLPPAGLAELKVGQVIDSDPITGLKVIVSDIGRERSHNIVTFTESGPGIVIQSKYDREKGVLLFHQADISGGSGQVEHRIFIPTKTQ